MNEQRYYAVLDEVSEIDLQQAIVVEHLGCYDFAYDALDRFLLFYDARKFFLYSYPVDYSIGELLDLKKVPTELPDFTHIVSCLAN